ncbi:unnamed protein product [Plutella xylostella]|uniref:(diamondback moth) hypothetical protein n=1 Tax=Plutella xylostella TaxID=51655 RepID=A0A8S4GBP2_PLUXY|nr:unnamed protein product [Plutella xylostella]
MEVIVNTEAATSEVEEEEEPSPPEPVVVPQIGTIEYLYYWGLIEGHLPTPIDVSITGSMRYTCPPLVWYNFDVYPQKIKITNTGYTVLIGAKWKTERPYLEGGPLLDKHVLSQIHFHWGATMMEGSDHSVDQEMHPAEMQVTFFRSEYLTQEEALKHHDGVVMVCYLIKYGVTADERLSWIIDEFPRIREAQTSIRMDPRPLSHLLPMFHEDYFLYWGRLHTVRGDEYAVRWLMPRTALYASYEQIGEFRKLWDPWDEPLLRNFRELQEREDRHIFFISPHYNQYRSLLPIPRVPEESISILSPAYQANPWMLPPENAYMLEQPEVVEEEKEDDDDDLSR